MNISDRQVNELMKLEPFQRYQHSIKLIADTEKMYSLVDEEGRWELAEIEGRVAFFLWPHEAYAKPFIDGEWKTDSIEEITISEYYNEIHGFLCKHEYLINVFAIHNLSGFVVTPDEFNKDIRDELAKYE